MGDIHVQPHADDVGSDQIIHLARLKHGDLTIERMWRQRAHHDGSAAPETPQHFSNGRDLLGRKGEDRRTLWQSGKFLGSGDIRTRTRRERGWPTRWITG